MTVTVALAALLGLGAGAGVLAIAVAFTPRPPTAPRRRPTTFVWNSARTRRLLIALAVGLLVGVVTSWPVAALLAAAAVWVLPALVGPDRAHRNQVARIEAVATWTESLRDTLSAAAGLEQAIVATAPHAPPAIRPHVQRLADRIRNDVRLPDALAAFGDEIDDATADLVAQALTMAARRHARHLAELLGALAGAARDQASLRMRVAASRARIRTSTRVITAITLTLAAGLVILDRGYLHPYDTATGQLVLLVVGALFGLGFWWLARISRIREEPRVLAHTTEEGARS